MIVDVLVVGGGPAGSSAARSSALSGFSTVLVEKQEEFTVVPCAEGIGSYLLPYLPFRIPSCFLKWRINGLYFSTKDFSILRKQHFFHGWSIERADFDTWLLRNARDSGAKILMNAELVDLHVNSEGNVYEAIVLKDGVEHSIFPSYVIAADGADSTVASLLRCDRKIGCVYSLEMENLDLIHPHMEQMYFGDFAPFAYAYVFPKSATTANIGVGGLESSLDDLEKLFDVFINDVIRNQTKNAVTVSNKSGKAAIHCNEWEKGNVLFAGSAANQNFKPYIEGILPSVICGDIAGKSVLRGNYTYNVNQVFGKDFRISDEIYERLLTVNTELSDEKKHLLNLFIFSFLDVKKIDKLIGMDVDKIQKKIVRLNRNPFNKASAELFYLSYCAKRLFV